MYQSGSVCTRKFNCSGFDCDVVVLMGSESLQITIPGNALIILPFNYLPTRFIVQTWMRMTFKRPQSRLGVPVHLALAVHRDKSHQPSSPRRRQ